MGNGADVFSGGGDAFATGFSTAYGDGLFGDGLDGNVVINSTVTLSREMYYNNLTITATGRLKPAGFRIFVKGTLTIASGGSIDDDGNLPSGATGGTIITARQTLGFGAGAGGNGGTQAVGGSGGGSGGSSSLNPAGLAPTGGGGGAGGGTSGGTGGGASQPIQGQRWNGTCWMQQGRFNNGTNSALYNGGAGGGGGGSDAATATGGGGGGGAGGVWIAAKYVVNAGRISANGANGANATGTAGNAGGGGGGAGGLVCVGTLSSDTLGTVQAIGGLGGTGFGTGGSGLAGRDGTAVVVVLS